MNIEIKSCSLNNLAFKFGLCSSTTRKWIKTNFPEFYVTGKRKSFFTRSEVEKIFNEFGLKYRNPEKFIKETENKD